MRMKLFPYLSQSGFSKPTKGPSCLKEDGWAGLNLLDFHLGEVFLESQMQLRARLGLPCIHWLSTYPDSGNEPPIIQRHHFPESHHGLRGGWLLAQGRRAGRIPAGNWPKLSSHPPLSSRRESALPSPESLFPLSHTRHPPPGRQCQIPAMTKFPRQNLQFLHQIKKPIHPPT